MLGVPGTAYPIKPMPNSKYLIYRGNYCARRHSGDAIFNYINYPRAATFTTSAGPVRANLPVGLPRSSYPSMRHCQGRRNGDISYGKNTEFEWDKAKSEATFAQRGFDSAYVITLGSALVNDPTL